MKVSRSLLVWATLALCAIMVLGAMMWLTDGVLAAGRERVIAERERTIAENRADLEERTRLALWRMDALGAAIMLRENRYPAADFIGFDFEYRPVQPEVLLHFDIRKGGTLRIPEFGSMPDPPNLSTVDMVHPERREQAKRLREFLAANPLPGDEWTQFNDAAQEAETTWNAVPKQAPVEQNYNKSQREISSASDLRKDQTYQNFSNTAERAQRAKAVAQSVDSASPQADRDLETSYKKVQADAKLADAPQISSQFELPDEVGQMHAVWVAGQLFLLRRVIWKMESPGSVKPTTRRVSVQGTWMDSQILMDQLLHEVADLLPKAKLVPVEGTRAAVDPLSMVSFPFRLDRSEALSAVNGPVKIPFGAPLWVAWSAVGFALLTCSLLVRGVMRLSERRASFVSAVTHELRTPLTTFRLYSDMLEAGAVKPENRGDYLRVLSREADRLSHLVENVLSFSKVERGSARSVVRETAVSDLLEPMRERLEARLATASLTLEMDAASDITLRVDSAAVEHILFNLIDNAAKYAATGQPPVVEISVKPIGKQLEILVRDHGPGILPAERRRIFRAFHKSAREAAETRPGVGLGLALSRRLAKSLGGSLDCVDSPSGASFALRLPLP